ncbi:glycosyltransferase family 2 protein [Ornithinibacillus bavariensis]|uniref:glycosyltransferase family 2 protein n=1 Tax=Ornithinibacillus bavariensis TaxID=545502 RepID=UPI000ECEAD7B|nr:glycosyltransferase family 2 protein [Ornithinibacillus sp.]
MIRMIKKYNLLDNMLFMNFRHPKKRPSYEIHKRVPDPKMEYLVTVITPVYNGEKFLIKSIESVINQSIGFHHIEYILIDDCSSDQSKEILLDYQRKYQNITVVTLDCNSGSPGLPRNIGIELASSPYITFLDADDWLDPRGLQVLYEILEETGDSYAVGRTIKVENTGTRIIGEHQCCKERRSVSPISIPHIFNHLGPTARMIRTSFIKEKQIQFPEMKFAEDKQFFMDVLAKCETISTTTKPIYYVNRLNETKETRLTNQTNILQKTNYNLQVARYILNQKYHLELEKMIINRIYEFDLLRGLFTTPHFQQTKLKLFYYMKFKQILRTTKTFNYNLSENFIQPIHKIIFNLIREGRYSTVTRLLNWDQAEKVKQVILKNNKPYHVVPFLEEKYKYIPLPLYVTFSDYFCKGSHCLLYVELYGDHIHNINDVIIRDLKNAYNEFVLPVSIQENGKGIITFPLDQLNDLVPANYSIFIRYNDYMKVNVRQLMNREFVHKYESRKLIFYCTSYSNIAVKVGSY